MPPDDDSPPQRPRWLGIALIVAVVLVVLVLGMLNVGWRTLQGGLGESNVVQNADAQTTPVNTVVTPPAAVLAAGKTAVEGSDCLRCHGVDRPYVGPAFNQISARYAQRPDAKDYIAGKIRNGGAGEWGRALMPRHPQLSEAQAQQMAQWVMSLPANP